jgi:REP element-mobilizing transposase RayT
MWTLYGWWLPNDPRGSTSCTIRNDLIADLGVLHHGRKSIQPASREIGEFYEQAAVALRYPLLAFSPAALATVAEAIGQAIAHYEYTCYACSVMPDHVHLIIRKHRDVAESMIDNIQRHAACGLAKSGLRPPDHPTWTSGGWKVFLDHPDEVRRTIGYVENNPVKMRLARQRWPLAA